MNANVVNNLSKNQRKRLRRKIRRDLQYNAGGNNQLALVAPPSSRAVVAVAASNNSQSGGQKKKRNRKPRGGRGTNSIGPSGNYYLMSLQDPVNCPGAKVPDLCSFPTGTFQLQQEYTMTIATGASGPDGCALVFSPIIGDSTGTVYFPIYKGYNTATNGSFSMIGNSWTSRAQVQAVYEQYRPVSASLEVEYVGTTMNDSGILVAGLLPRRTMASGYQTLVAAFDQFSQEEYTKTTAAREGIRVVWKPQDNMDFEFRPSLDSSSTPYMPPAIAFAASGMQQGAGLRVTIVCNYEGIPQYDASNFIDTQPSPINVGMLSQALQWAGQAINNVGPLVHNVSPFVRPIVAAGLNAAAGSFSRRVANRARAALTF